MLKKDGMTKGKKKWWGKGLTGFSEMRIISESYKTNDTNKVNLCLYKGGKMVTLLDFSFGNNINR